MDKISIIGLDGCGKTTYIIGMADCLFDGIEFSNGNVLKVESAKPRQATILSRAVNRLHNGKWPYGTIMSTDYSFNIIDKQDNTIMSFCLTDYRGVLLVTDEEDEKEEQEQLFKTFQNSSVLCFFIGADTVKKAMLGDSKSIVDMLYLSNLHEKYLNESNYSTINTMSELTKTLGLIIGNPLYKQYSAKENDSQTPVMVVITKSDMLSINELTDSQNYLKEKFGYLFGQGTNIITAITSVSLGENLTIDEEKLGGNLEIGSTSGNLYMPIFFSLYCKLKKELKYLSSNAEIQSSIKFINMIEHCLTENADIYENGHKLGNYNIKSVKSTN